MLRFIDIETGNTFDGEKPYVFWLDNEQSININYIKQICFVSTSNRVCVNVKDGAGIFKLVNLNNLTNESKQLNKEKIRSFEYVPLDSTFKRQSNDISLLTDTLWLDGFKTEYGYIYMIYVIARATAAAEFHTDIEIIEGAGTTIIEVAGDFYARDESLQNNLQNYGTVLPTEIQQAIYEVPLTEESPDAIVLNRKWKELLLNYINVICGKGNYKAIEDSVAWFEYGERVKLFEYWEKNEMGKDRLLRRELDKLFNDEVKELITYQVKTTYISLALGLVEHHKSNSNWTIYETLDSKKNIVKDDNGNVFGSLEYAYLDKKIQNAFEDFDREFMHTDGSRVTLHDWDIPGHANDETTKGANLWREDDAEGRRLPEPNPDLFKVALMWSRDILMLKLSLMNKFLGDYFLPIHIDSLFSSVEEIIYTNVIKLTYDNRLSRRDTIESFKSFNVDYNETLTLTNIKFETNNWTVGADVIYNGPELQKFKYILGVSTGDDMLSLNDTDHFVNYNGPGVIQNVKLTFNDNIVLTRLKLRLNAEFTDSDNNWEKFAETDIAWSGKTFDFDIAIFDVAKYSFTIELSGPDGVYVKTIKFECKDNSVNYLSFYNIEKLTTDELLLQLNKENYNNVAAYRKSITQINNTPKVSNLALLHESSNPTNIMNEYIVLDRSSNYNNYKYMTNRWVLVTSTDWTLLHSGIQFTYISMWDEIARKWQNNKNYLNIISHPCIAGDGYYGIWYSQHECFASQVAVSNGPNLDMYYTFNVYVRKLDGISKVNVRIVPVLLGMECDTIIVVNNNGAKHVMLGKKNDDGSVNLPNGDVIPDPYEEYAAPTDYEYPVEYISDSTHITKCYITPENAKIGYTNCIIYPYTDGQTFNVTLYEDEGNNSNDGENLTFEQLKSKYGWYWWNVINTDNNKYLYGVRKVFNLDDVNVCKTHTKLDNAEFDIFINYYFKMQNINNVRKMFLELKVNNVNNTAIDTIENTDARLIINTFDIEININGEVLTPIVLDDVNNTTVFDVSKFLYLFNTKSYIDFTVNYKYKDTKTGITFYKSLSSKFRKIVHDDIYGLDKYKVKTITSSNDINIQYANRYQMTYDRFVPLFHKPVKTSEYVFGKDDCVAIVPEIRYSDIGFSDIQWTFINNSKHKEYIVKDINNNPANVIAPLIADYGDSSTILDSGCYDVLLKYKVGNVLHEQLFPNQFIIKHD